MGDDFAHDQGNTLARALILVEQALELCDLSGYAFAAIDLCAAADKLQALQAMASADAA